MIDILTSFEHYLSIGVQKQTRCILLKARHLYLSLTSTVFSGYHYKGLFTMKVTTSILFPRSPIRKTKPLTPNHYPLLSMQKLIGGVIFRHIETFLATFPSCGLCAFIFPLRDVSYIRPGNFKIASIMASGIEYCLHMTIYVSIYKGLNEISHFSNPVRGLRTQSVLEGALVGTHVSLTNLTRLLDYDKLLRIDFAHFLSISLTSISCYCEDNLDVLVHLDFNELPDLESTFHYHHMLICYRIGSQVMPFTQEKFNLCISRVMVYNVYLLDLYRICHSLQIGNKAISKDEGTHGFKPKLKIFRVGKPLKPFALIIEDNPSYIKVLRIDVTIRAASIYFVLDRTINEDDKLHIGACETSFKKEESDDVKFKGKFKRCFSLNNDEAESTPKPMLHWCPIHHIRIPLKCSIKPFLITYFVLPSLKGDFNSFYAINFQRGIDVNPLESKETNCEVFDLQSQIDITNATEIIDPSTKAILEKTKAYIKESVQAPNLATSYSKHSSEGDNRDKNGCNSGWV
ncbi:hypothetical protein Cgig2_004642 [Carnegiea gigantea]|uniref:Uncharacterized protein n=1 Tax=Carnegiea gigantea TaxID=171969 RepID=A0A9Q1QD16_9CARY|nr:hypothetical protein Cgig2_004642 [Carnegiea gigantea]